MTSWYGRRPVLTEEQAAELDRYRQLLAQIPPVAQLAERMRVSRTTIRNYLTGQRVPKRHQRMRIVGESS